jgi:hypothetical protein
MGEVGVCNCDALCLKLWYSFHGFLKRNFKPSPFVFITKISIISNKSST